MTLSASMKHAIFLVRYAQGGGTITSTIKWEFEGIFKHYLAHKFAFTDKLK